MCQRLFSITSHAMNAISQFQLHTNTIWQNAGYPDVSLLANDIKIIVNGVSASASSTGGSAIIFAAMISLINAHRGAQNSSSIGFINPFLYQRADELYYPPKPALISDDGVSFKIHTCLYRAQKYNRFVTSQEMALCSANALCKGLSGDCCPTAATPTSSGEQCL